MCLCLCVCVDRTIQPPGRRQDEELLEHESRKERARAGPKAELHEDDPVKCPNRTRAQINNEAHAPALDR